MIVGVGIDVASVTRIATMYERYGQRVIERLLSAPEREFLEARSADKMTALAGRFAAKEAAVKALGAPRDIGWHDLRVLRENNGAPRLEFHGRAAEHAAARGAVRQHLSISHDAGVAVAVVILETA